MDMDVYLRFVLALVFVLALIAGVGWAARRYGLGGRLAGQGAGRRLAVVETAMVDAKRRLAIVRRDGVEHLILMGGPADLVIETGIAPPAGMPVPAGTDIPAREPARPVPSATSRADLPKFVQTLKLAERLAQAGRSAFRQGRIA